VKLPPPEPFVDVHCHLLPGIDDGAESWDEALAMARIAVSESIGTVVATPHQLGNYAHNRGDEIRSRVEQMRQLLDHQEVPLSVLPGADVRIDPGMAERLRSGDVLTLADQGRHVLLELPHEIYFPLEPVIDSLAALNMVSVLSHPERNKGLWRAPHLLPELVDRGCLMQVTAGSFTGAFGDECRQLSEWMLQHGLVHLVSTDAHGAKARRPVMCRAFARIVDLADESSALDLCCRHPALVVEGADVPAGRRHLPPRGWLSRFGWRKAG